MKLPKFQSNDQALQQLQSRWSSILDPIIDLPINSAVILRNVVLSSSAVISHTLGRRLQGWVVIRQRGDATIYDRQDVNPNPDKTLLLTASSGISVDLLCF